MHPLEKLIAKPKKLVLGLMSGTSLDGMDAALVEIEGAGLSTRVRFIGYHCLAYDDKFRAVLMKAAQGEEGGSRLICSLNFYIGKIALRAGLELCGKIGLDTGSDENKNRGNPIDLAGSHGQTVFHQSEPAILDSSLLHSKNDITGDFLTRGTLQIGKASVIAEGLGCPVVSDFRVADMAAGGQGAPLVPYTEYLLYRQEKKTVALQNIGGIGNITLLPMGCDVGDVLAFDTGPGNMIIDGAAKKFAGKPMDEDGHLAGSGRVEALLLERMFALDRDYHDKKPPKSTGRERYNEGYMQKLFSWAVEKGFPVNDIMATVTRYTAETIALSIKQCSPIPDEVYISGGGLHNKTMMNFIRELLPFCTVRPGDDLGIPADAKEAAAFAILANETVHGICNNAPSATGAKRPVVMGKISLC